MLTPNALFCPVALYKLLGTLPDTICIFTNGSALIAFNNDCFRYFPDMVGKQPLQKLLGPGYW